MNLLKIKQRREELQYTQEYVAGKLGISQNMYSLLESGRAVMKVDQLILIAQVLDAEPAEFLKQEPVIINMDNATLEKGSGAFLNSSIVNKQETSEELIDLLKTLTVLLHNISNKLQP